MHSVPQFWGISFHLFILQLQVGSVSALQLVTVPARTLFAIISTAATIIIRNDVIVYS